MQLPVKAHYATQAMLVLALQHQAGHLTTSKTIADQYGIPSQFLGQILQQLRSAGLISSVRGSSGGFRLARSPSRITLADVVEAIGCGSTTESAAPSDRNAISEAVSKVWNDLAESQREYLQGITLAELLSRLSEETVSMFYI